jgi:hypothetical protein
MCASLYFPRTAAWDESKLSGRTTTIQLGSEFDVTDEHIAVVAANCPKLLEFSAGSQDCGYGSRCTPQAVTALVNSCPLLKKLSLWSFTRIDDATAIHIASTLHELQELCITGHDKSRGGVTGRFLRALAGHSEEYEEQVKAAELDFKQRIKDCMRGIINRERAKEGRPALPKADDTEKQQREARRQLRQARADACDVDQDDQDEDEFDEDEFDDDYDDYDDKDEELEMLREEGRKYFEAHDMEDEESLALEDMYGGGRGSRYPPEEGLRPGDFSLTDFSNDSYVVVEKRLPEAARPAAFLAPKLRKVNLQDQSLGFSSIGILKAARKQVKVFDGESCGSGYASQMVYSMVGQPGGWY